jgi:dihydroflavonol-4-reductase
MTTIAITGATGLLGANVAVEALRRGWTVRCIRRRSSRIEHLAGFDIDWRDADLGAPDALRGAFRGVDAVFHCAASTSVLPTVTPELYDANVTGTDNVLAAIDGARLVHCSSTVAVGISEDTRPCDETATWNFERYGLDDGYARTKHMAEERVRQAVAHGAVDAVIVNPTYMFGPYDQRPSSGQMILQVARGRAIAYTPGVNDFVDVRDVAQGMLLAHDAGRAGERYILSGESRSYGEMFTAIAKVVGRPPPRFRIGRRLAAPVGWWGDVVQRATGKEQPVTTMTLRWGCCDAYRFTSDKARRELGYTTRPVDEAVVAAWEWFKTNGMAPA